MLGIDSHCHLDHVSFHKDLHQVLERANQQGIHQFVISGVGFHQWQDQQKLANDFSGIFNAFGVHPWFCDLHQEVHLEQLDELLFKEAIAVGECGLDLMPNRPNKENQLKWFQNQLALAKKHNLPLIIHSVRANDIIVQQLKLHPESRGVIHGFHGSLQQAKTFIQLGFHIGIGTRLIHAHSNKTQALLTELPLESILLETDSPDGLGKSVRNEPMGIKLIANIMAKLRNQDSDTILSTCSKTAQELFQL